MDNSASSWAAVGHPGGDANVGSRLGYRSAGEMETAFDATVQGRILWRVGLRAVFGALLIYFLFLFFALVFAAPRTNFSQSFLNPGVQTTGLLMSLAWLFGTWLVPYREPLSEWSLLLDGKAGAADSAYAAIFDTLKHREIPVGVVPTRMRTGLGVVRNYLVIKQNKDTVHISVFPYGTGLFIGWQMWRRQLPVIMVGTWLGQRIATLTLVGTHFHALLRADLSRALRDAVHNAAREGLEAAQAGLQVPMQATFGYDVPITADETATRGTPPPPPIPPPPAPPALPPQARPSDSDTTSNTPRGN